MTRYRHVCIFIHNSGETAIRTGVNWVRKIKASDGKEYYGAIEVESEIKKLENYIKILEKKLEKNTKNLRPREPKYPKNIQIEIAKRVLQKESKRSLAEEFGVSRSTILRYCKENGVEALLKIESADEEPQKASQSMEDIDWSKVTGEVEEELTGVVGMVRKQVVGKVSKEIDSDIDKKD